MAAGTGMSDAVQSRRLFSFHPGEGRDPCLMQRAGGAMGLGLRRGGT